MVKEFLKFGVGNVLANFGIINQIRAGANESMTHAENWEAMKRGTWMVKREPPRNNYRPETDKEN